MAKHRGQSRGLIGFGGGPTSQNFERLAESGNRNRAEQPATAGSCGSVPFVPFLCTMSELQKVSKTSFSRITSSCPVTRCFFNLDTKQTHSCYTMLGYSSNGEPGDIYAAYLLIPRLYVVKRVYPRSLRQCSPESTPYHVNFWVTIHAPREIVVDFDEKPDASIQMEEWLSTERINRRYLHPDLLRATQTGAALYCRSTTRINTSYDKES